MIWVQFWALFWGPFLDPALVPVIVFSTVGAQNKAIKQGPKLDPNPVPKTQSRAPNFVRRRKQGRADMIFSQESARRSYSTVNNFSQKGRKLRPAKLLKQRQHIYIYKPYMVKQCFTAEDTD